MTHLRADDWFVASIERHSDAARLVRALHYSRGCPNTSVYRHGMWRSDYPWGDPWAVAVWIPAMKGAAVRLAEDAWGGGTHVVPARG